MASVLRVLEGRRLELAVGSEYQALIVPSNFPDFRSTSPSCLARLGSFSARLCLAKLSDQPRTLLRGSLWAPLVL